MPRPWDAVGTASYDVYGVLTGTAGTATTPFGFAGEYRDAETGFVYLRARYYDASTGRFLTQDPIPFVQRHGYAGGNPLAYVDPWGLDEADAWCLTTTGVGLYQRCAYDPNWNYGPLTATVRFGDSYYDLNATGCFGMGCLTGGLQWSLRQGPDWYVGLGTGTTGGSLSLTMAPNKSISPGFTCGLQGTSGPLFGPVGIAGQWGVGGISYGTSSAGERVVDKDNPGAAYWEVGISLGPPSASATCFWVQPF